MEEVHQEETYQAEAHQEEALQAEEHQEVDLPEEDNHPHNKHRWHNQYPNRPDHGMN